jgi:raffinose/stachyose/melibiose transport system permease protein
VAAQPVPSRRRLARRARRRVTRLARIAILLLAAVAVAYPLLLIVSTALKEPLQVATDPFGLFTATRIQNLADAWTIGGFGRYFLNTVLITAPTVVAVVALSTVAGYAFARLEFPFREPLFYAFMLGLMIPFFSIMIPLYYELRTFGLLDHLPAVILPAIAGAADTGLPLGVFLMRAFFQDLPRELADAARVDGASEWQVFRRVLLPLAAPGAAVLAVLTFLSAWNTFTLPLIYLPGEENRTLATGLYLFASGRTQETELVAAGTLIMALPVIVFFLLFQRQFVKGMTVGAIKG